MTLATTDTPGARTPGNGRTENLPAIAPPRLPYHPTVEERFGVDRASWKALVEAIFPTATSTESVILALSYCRARKLDPFKRNVHIVPIWNKQLKRMVDTIWPGIGELRTTAFRTGEFAGRDKAEFGPVVTKRVGRGDVTFPEWCQVTVYRLVKGQRVAFAGPQVYWEETYATAARDDDSPNEMWATRTRGQIEKCAEAAALRAAFPEEIGSDYIPEEVQHDRVRSVDSTTVATATGKRAFGPPPPQLQPHPTDEAQVIDTADGNLPDAEHAERIISGAPRAAAAEQQPPDPDVSGSDAEPPADALPDLSSFEKFQDAMADWAMTNNIDSTAFTALMGKVKLHNKIDRPTTAGTEERKRVYAAAVSGHLGPDGKVRE